MTARPAVAFQCYAGEKGSPFSEKNLCRRTEVLFGNRECAAAFPERDYLMLPESTTVTVVAGMASMALETVISPLNIFATRAA